MRIMITGAKGQLGHDCCNVLGQSHEIVAVDLQELDITRPAQVNRMVGDVRPDVLINCAAHTGVDACETEQQEAWQLNASAPGYLAEALSSQGGVLLHISTDYVFDGKKPVPKAYLEIDPPGPLSVYGKTKLEGEAAIRKILDRHIIVRTAWLYGMDGHNFLKTMLRLAKAQPAEPVKVVSDQFGSPTWTHRLALQIEVLIERNGRGVYHATSEGVCTWFELAKAFLERLEIPHRLVPCTTDEYPTPAIRPENSILENDRLNADGINVMTPWQEDLNLFVETYRDELLELDP